MSWGSTWLRIFFTIVFLSFLFFFIPLGNILEVIKKCDLVWILITFILMPVFIAVRITKWFTLVGQVDENIDIIKITPGYMRAMALGLITPGRLGELARIQGMKQPGRCAGLFFLEKLIEVACLISLCIIAAASLYSMPWQVIIALVALMILCFICWRKLAIAPIRFFFKRFKPSSDRLEKVEWAIKRINIGSCTLLSTLCFIIYTIQIYLVLLSMETPSDPLILPLIPIVLLSNLVPITIGGYGIRETFAVFLFESKGIEAAVAASSVGIVTFFDLVIPAFVGTGIQLFTKPPGNAS